MARKDYIPALDGLRAIAALLIVWVHIPRGVLCGWVDSLAVHLPLGYLAVDTFFVLSGFLITRILLVDRDQGLPVSYFLLRRCLRIFPIYYLTIAVLAVVDPRTPLIWCAGYLSNFYFAFDHSPHPMRHVWSLAVEEHFYLVWPFIVYGLSVKHSRNCLIFGIFPVAILGAVAVILLDGWVPADALIYRGSMFRFLSLGIGALLAYYESQLDERRGVAWLGVIMSFTAGCLGIVVMKRGILYQWNPLTRMVAGALISGSIVQTTIALRHSRGSLIAVLRSSPLRFIGQISYGLYLYHYPIYYAFGVVNNTDNGSPAFLTVVLAVATTFTVAMSSYFVVEKPLRKLKDRFRTRTDYNVLWGVPA